MKFAAKLSPRAVMTTGKASSAAGLTAAAVQEGAQWTLEAGALVLADGGLCCIDEFDGIREADRWAVLVALGHWGMTLLFCPLLSLSGHFPSAFLLAPVSAMLDAGLH